MTGQNIMDLVTAARQRQQKGDFEGAARHYKSAIKRDKNNAALLTEAGVNAAQLGDMDTAGNYLLKARKLNPHSSDVNFNLGHVFLDQRRDDQALRAFEQAEAIEADYPGIDFSLAEALFRLGRTEEAARRAKAATDKSPGDYDAWLLRGRCYDQQQLHLQAEQMYEQVLKLVPEHIDGRLLLARDHVKRFLTSHITELLEPLENNPDLPHSVLVQIGDIYGSSQHTQKAISVLTRALQANPHDATAHCVLGTALIDLGDFVTAEHHLRQALKLDVNQALAYQSLADIKRLTEDDRKDLEALYHSKTLGNHFRSLCGFALYYLNDRAGRYNEAFAALTHANELLHLDDPHDVGANQQQLMRLMSVISNEFMSQRVGQGYSGQGAVFIVGMPRSGTTLTEQILSSHPSVHAGGERPNMTELRSNINGFPEGIQNLDETWAETAGKRIHDAMFAGDSNASIATDKLPGNYAFLGLIKWILPNAKFIYCRRQPEANALSIFEQHFMTLPFSRNLADIAQAYDNHLSLMRHWRDECGIDVLTVDYEALVQDPEPIARQIYDYVGLEWRSEYLDITKVDRQINTASRWQARQPINTSSVERWRRYEEHLKPFTEALGTAKDSP